MGGCCFRPAQESSSDEIAAGGHASGSHRRPHGTTGTLVGNKLICTKPPSWTSENPITRGQLRSKRDAFWDTSPSYGGRPEIWQALKAAAETDDNATAQAFVDAVNVTLPSGNLTLVYDELGNKYEIPPYCLSDPSNLIHELGATVGDIACPTDDSSCVEGAGVSAEKVSLRLRLSTTNEDLEWSGPWTATGAHLKAFVEKKKGGFVAGRQERKGIQRERMRCLFGGKIITDTQTIAAAKLLEDVVVIVAIFEEPRPV